MYNTFIKFVQCDREVEILSVMISIVRLELVVFPAVQAKRSVRLDFSLLVKLRHQFLEINQFAPLLRNSISVCH